MHGADQLLREDPVRGVAALVRGYAGNLPPEQGAAVVNSVLESVGIRGIPGLQEQERQRLAHYDRQAAEYRAHQEALVPQVRAQVERFRQANPHFEQHRLVAASFVHTGAARTIEEAFTLARRAAGVPTPQEAAAKAADEERR